jgi:hypothetical protein
VISPWTVGSFVMNGVDEFRQRVLEPDLTRTRELGIDYLPVAFPGVSEANMQRRPESPMNAMPRLGGRFYWRQIHTIVASGASTLFTAMFDEVDEGTAILKAAPTQALTPVEGQFLALDADGERLPSDWYLRLAGAGGKMLRGEIPLSPEIPVRR